MFKPEDYQEAIQNILGLWEQRSSYPGWHGFGIRGDSKPDAIFLYVAPEEDSTQLLNDAKQKEGPPPKGLPIDIRRIPRFCLISSSTQAASLAPTPNENSLRPGQGLFAFSPDKTCSGVPGTLGAFLEQANAKNDEPIWLLSCRHVLLPKTACEESTTIFREIPNGEVATDIKAAALDPQGSLTDAAIATTKIDVDPLNPAIAIKDPTPFRPKFDAPVQKLGNKTHLTCGTILHCVPRIELHPNGDAGFTLFKDQILIQGSSPAHFADEGDSGALVVSEGRPVGLLIAMEGPPSSPCGCFVVATPFDTVLSELSKVLEDELKERSLQLMLKKR